MNRNDVKELYFITPIENIPSIFKHGLLSHNRIKALAIPHKSIADDEVQKLRAKKVIPGGKGKLHDYVNLYFNPRNAMMFKRKDGHSQNCVLGINAAILDEPKVIITDGNAAANDVYVGFFSPSLGLQRLDKKMVFARSWWSQNPYEMCRRRSTVCAEVLVRDQLSVSNITCVYVSCEESSDKIKAILVANKIDFTVIINSKMFFQEA